MHALLALLLIPCGCDGDVRRPDVPGADTLICPELMTGREVLFPSMGRPSLIGDYLYVPIERDGKGSVSVLRIAGRTVEAVGEADGLEGYPLGLGWEHVADAIYARFHDGQMDVLDARDPLHPKREVLSLGESLPVGEGIFGRAGTKLFACVQGEVEGQLVSIDIAGTPSEPTHVPSAACHDPWLSMLASTGSVWAEITWVGPTKEAQALTIYSLESGAPVASHVAEGETAWTRFVVGERFVAAWTWDEETLQVMAPGDDAPVSLPNPGFFDFLVGDVGYAVEYGFPDSPVVRTVDLSDLDDVETNELSFEKNPLFEGHGYLMQVVHDEHRLVVVTEVGDLWVMPFGKAGSLEPLVWINENGNAVCPGQ